MRSCWSPLRRRLALAREGCRDGRALLFAHALCFAVALPALLRLPLPRLRDLLERTASGPRRGRMDKEAIAASITAMLQAARPLVRTGCLTRGITLYYFLRRAGVDVELSFGVGRDGGQPDGFDGHCWLTLDGEPYLERRDPRPLYSVMYVFRRGGCSAASAGARCEAQG